MTDVRADRVVALRLRATALLAGGDRIGARRALLSALAAAVVELGPDDREVALVQHGLGAAALRAGDLDEAAERFALADERLVGGDRAALEHDLGALAYARGDLDAAEHHTRLALDVPGAGAGARAQLGAIASARGHHAEAVALLDAAMGELAAAPVEAAFAQAHLGAALHRAGRPDDAERAYRASLDATADLLGAGHPDRVPALLGLARLADERADPDAARALAEQALAALEGHVAAGHPDLQAARERALSPTV